MERRRLEADHGRQDGIRHWLESRGRKSGSIRCQALELNLELSVFDTDKIGYIS